MTRQIASVALTLLCAALTLSACRAPQTGKQAREEQLPMVKQYLVEQGIPRESIGRIRHDQQNNIWHEYWDGDVQMTAPAKPWHAKLHTIWVYEILIPGGKPHDLVWVFLDRETMEPIGYLGDLEE